MMVHSIQTLDHCINLCIMIRHDDLERAKQLLRASFEVCHKLIDWNFDGCRLIGSINLWNWVILKRFSSKCYFCSWNRQHLIDVGFDFFVWPGDNWPHCQIFQLSSFSKLLNFFYKSCLYPIFMYKNHRLCWAFLTTGSIRILIRLPTNILKIFDIRT